MSAQDKGTGKEQKITIKANSGLSEDEIQNMIKEAEANAESDKRQRELIETRNSAESQVNSMREELVKHGDKLTENEKASIEDQLVKIEEAAKGEDAEAIGAELGKIFEIAAPLYKAMSESMAPPEGAPTTEQKDDVVDATFTEVKDKNSKAA